MKNIRYVIFTVIFLFLNIFYVQASCTNEELLALKEEADKIKITYKHMGVVEREEYTDYNSFEVTVKNASDKFYITYLSGSERVNLNNEEVKITLRNGTWYFKVFSSECDCEVSEIKVFLPRFNMYYLDPLCKGIDGDDFALCGKYYEYDVDYDNFVARVNHYRATYKIKDSEITDEENNFEVILNNLLDFVIKYKLYVIVTLIVILFVIVTILIVRKRKKRGVLE